MFIFLELFFCGGVLAVPHLGVGGYYSARSPPTSQRCSLTYQVVFMLPYPSLQKHSSEHTRPLQATCSASVSELIPSAFAWLSMYSISSLTTSHSTCFPHTTQRFTILNHSFNTHFTEVITDLPGCSHVSFLAIVDATRCSYHST